MGILPQALANYLALLGWGAEGGTRETFTREELIAEFKLERVTPSPAVFDWDKLHWLNRHVPSSKRRCLNCGCFPGLTSLRSALAPGAPPTEAVESVGSIAFWSSFYRLSTSCNNCPRKAAALWHPAPVAADRMRDFSPPTQASARGARSFSAKDHGRSGRP